MMRDGEILQNLERKLSLKQLQIKSLLNVTQAINSNIKIAELFQMYESFLSWEMGVKRMLFFLKTEAEWSIPSHLGTDADKFLNKGIIDYLLQFHRLKTIRPEEKPELHDFDLLIPVYHKSQVLSYALIGGLEKSSELYDIIQFITTITNIVTVAIENKRLFNRRVRQEALEQELVWAQEVQKMLIPDYLPRDEYVDVSYLYKPHYNIGGDYIDYIPLEDDRFLICIADISGKGVSAALLMTHFQALLRSHIYHYRGLSSLIQEINHSVYNTTKGDKYVTFFVAEVEPKAGQIWYINAGHHPPRIFVDGEMQILNKGAMVLGAFEELPFVEVGEVHFEDEARLLMFTDGLTDIVNKDGQYFDERQLEKFLTEENNIYSGDLDLTLGRLEQSIEDFCGSKDFPDDIAIMLTRIAKHEK